MKKIFSIILLSLFVISCSEDGAPGPEGAPGADGLIGSTFEATVDLEDPEYSVFIEIPESIEVLESDAVLVYLLEAVDEQTGADVWSLLPQTFYLEDGEIQYNFNHTSFDVNVYLQGNVPLNTLGPAFTDDQTFRMVVVPSDFAVSSGVNLTNYNEVKAALNLKDGDIKKTHQIKK